MNYTKYLICLVLAYILIFRIIGPYLFSASSWLAIGCGVTIICVAVYYGVEFVCNAIKGEESNEDE